MGEALPGGYPEEPLALLLASEAASYAIVRFKDAERLASEKLAAKLAEQRKKLEGVAAAAEAELAEKLQDLL